MIFLSYSHRDFKIVAEFYIELSKQTSEQVWFGPEQISFGENWEDKVNYAISNSRLILMLIDGTRTDLDIGLNFNREIRMIQNSLSKNKRQNLAIAQIGQMVSPDINIFYQDIPFSDNIIRSPIINFSNIYYGDTNIDLGSSSEFRDLVNVIKLKNPR